MSSMSLLKHKKIHVVCTNGRVVDITMQNQLHATFREFDPRVGYCTPHQRCTHYGMQ